jgi:hypothetical protein
MATLLDIKNLFENICTAHSQVRSFHFDYLDKIATKKDVEYIAVLMAPESVDISRASNTFNFQLVVLDKVDKQNENDLIVLENARQVLLDIIAEVELKSYATMGIVNGSNLSIDDVRDNFNDDIVVGWLTRVSIKVPNELDACGIPYQTPPGVVLLENNFPLLLEF